MRILHVRFANLNSLQGEWQVDFTHPAYQADSIFAISGPTGSGKTTILDAISLALYGRTPRLKIISKSVNEILTRQTGYCFSEVTFETLRGRYRCHWSQHRARRHPAGELQQPRHEIVNCEDDRVIESTIKNVARKVEQVIGMNFDQFTKSILLAQGSFAAFLDAAADVRAPILEQITGTELYSRISQKVYERSSHEENLFRQVQSKIEDLSLLSQEEERALKEQQLKTTSEIASLKQQQIIIEKSLAWYERYALLDKDISAREEVCQTLQAEIEYNAPKRRQLDQAKNSQTLSPYYRQLEDLRQEQFDESREKEKKRQEHDALQATQASQHHRKESSFKALEDKAKELEREKEISARVTEIDIACENLSVQRKKLKSKQKEICIRYKAILDEKANLEKMISSISNEIKEHSLFLDHHKEDSTIGEELGAIEQQVTYLAETKKKIRQLEEHSQNQKKICSKYADTCSRMAIEQENFRKNISQKSESITELEKRIQNHQKEFPAIRERLEGVNQRVVEYDKLYNLIVQRNNLIKEREEITSRNREREKIIAQLNQEKERLTIELKSQERIVEQQEKLYLLTQRIGNLEDERSRLKAGEPCPLCGSKQHPYSLNVPLKEDVEEEKLKGEKGQLALYNNTLLSREKELVKEELSANEEKKQLEKLHLQLNDIEESVAQFSGVTTFTDEPEQLKKISHTLAELTKQRQLLKAAAVQEEEWQEKLSSQRESLYLLKDDYAKLQEKVHSKNNERVKTETDQRQLLTSLKEKEEERKLFFSKLKIHLQRYGLTPTDDTAVPAAISSLRQRHHLQIEKTAQMDNGLQQKQKAETELEKLSLQFEGRKREKHSIREEIEELDSQLSDNRSKRREIYGERNPAAEIRRLENEEKDLRAAYQQQEKEHAEHHNRMQFLEKEIHQLSKRIETRKNRLDDLEKEFFKRLEKSQFTDTDHFLTSCLPDNEIEEMTQFFIQMDEGYQREIAILKARREELAAHVKNSRPIIPQAELEAHAETANTSIEEKQQEAGKIVAMLEENSRIKAVKKEHLDALAAQQLELERWKKLNHLIGSASGNKFRNYVQGITFEQMVRLANRNLRRMTDRYILTRDVTHPLGLNVIDNYRGGDIRSTTNLSGGESFLVSLSLALGLSNMASNNISVDSLFLDEGFGTLDEETLETALQALAGLRHEGKTIGVISHIQQLKERLESHIQVVPGNRGHSRLQGPGIDCLS